MATKTKREREQEKADKKATRQDKLTVGSEKRKDVPAPEPRDGRWPITAP